MRIYDTTTWLVYAAIAAATLTILAVLRSCTVLLPLGHMHHIIYVMRRSIIGPSARGRPKPWQSSNLAVA